MSSVVTSVEKVTNLCILKCDSVETVEHLVKVETKNWSKGLSLPTVVRGVKSVISARNERLRDLFISVQ